MKLLAHNKPNILRSVLQSLLFKVVHWQEMRLRVQGQEQDPRSRELRQVSDESYLGQGDQNPRKCWIRQGQVRSQPSSTGHGREDQNHDVPKQNLIAFVQIRILNKWL